MIEHSECGGRVSENFLGVWLVDIAAVAI